MDVVLAVCVAGTDGVNVHRTLVGTMSAWTEPVDTSSAYATVELSESHLTLGLGESLQQFSQFG